MGLRFNKKIKLGKGVSLNLNKNSIGMSIGGKGAKYTVNSKGQQTASVGISGTGLYYSKTTGTMQKEIQQSAGGFVVGGKKQKLLEWQNTLLSDPAPKLIMTETQLKQETNRRAENDLRIINDCIKILEDTTNPDTYFSRLELMTSNINDLLMLEPYADFKGASPRAAMVEFVNQKQISINRFLVRYFSTIFDKAENLKTEKGKLNQYQKFYESLQPYYDFMESENIDYIETKYRAYTRTKK